MAHLSMEAVRGEPRGRVPLLGVLKYIYIYGKALETGISFHRGPTGEPGWAVHLLGTSRETVKEGSGNRVSLNMGICEGNLEGGLAPLLETLKDI